MLEPIQLTLQEEALRLRLEKQDQCRHKFIYKTVAWLEDTDETVEIAICPLCGFNQD